MFGLIVLGNLLPDGHGFRVQLHMHPFNDRCGRGACGAEHESNACRCGKAYQPAAQACACVPNRHDRDPPSGISSFIPQCGLIHLSIRLLSRRHADFLSERLDTPLPHTVI
ncbi:hypothetical protein D3C87_1631800 [compost metagenome]